MTTEAQKPLRVFCSYAREDEEHLNVLREWLSGLKRQGLIEWWHDREIVPGWEWEEAIDKRLRTADIILLLVTSDFLGSDYVYEKEIRTAIERYERHEALVIAIIVRPALWQDTPLNKFQLLPKDAKPITRWPDRDEAWLNVTEGIQKAVEELLVERQEKASKERYREALVAQEGGRRVGVIYAEGQRHMDVAEWEQALECFEEVQQLEAGYQDTDELLSQVRQKLTTITVELIS